MVAFYRVSLVSTRFYLVLLGFIISLWVVMVLPRFLPSFIRFHRVFISSYWISLGSTSSYQVLPSSLGFTSSFTVIISFHWISRSSFLPIFTRCTIYFSLHYLVSLWFSFWVAKWLRCFLFQFLERNGQRCCLFVLF